MDTASFLDRVIAPGNFIAIMHKTSAGKMMHRFFPRANTRGAAGYIHWANRQGLDAWYAVASYTTAEPDAKGNLEGRRLTDNAQALQTLFADLDVKDGAFASRADAVQWIKGFIEKTKIPAPNLWINSGYGLHVYWTLKDPLPPTEWKPLADALKAAMIAHDAKFDVAIISDAARVLRAPGTFNLKVPDSPAPVEMLRSFDHYDNEILVRALAPYTGAVAQPAAVQAGLTGAGLVANGPAPVYQLRAQPAQITEAARNGMPEPRRQLFANIARDCEQVKRSLSTHGAGDKRDLWYRGYATLAIFTTDGREWLHEIGKGHHKYDPVETDTEFDRAQNERERKVGLGAPLCAAMNGYRTGVCPSCPHWGSVRSPIALAADEGDGDLPDGYRRRANTIEGKYYDKKKEEWQWRTILGGDTRNPILDRVGEDYKLTFEYIRAGHVSAVTVMQSAVPTDVGGIVKHFGVQGVSGLYHDNALKFGGYLVAWIERLRDLRMERNEVVPPFGWVYPAEPNPDGSVAYAGLSVAGNCYRNDGGIERAPGGDPRILSWYKPRGTLAGWQHAAEFTMRGRPDLQVLIAAAFGSPLIEFTGFSGFCMSAWSRDSAVGKSSALMIGTSVWAGPEAMIQLDDTVNSIVHRIGAARICPAYWDEVTLSKEDEDRYVQTLFQLGQGKEKSRLNADASLKESGTWKTMLVTTGNRPLMDAVIRRRADTDAGAVRLFEFLVSHKQMDLRPEAQRTISSAADHAGNAGAVYAGWLARNYAAAAAMVKSRQEELQRLTGGRQQERFFIAGMSCLLVGAAIARDLNLAPFDVPAMQDYLVAAFNGLRKERGDNLPVNNGVFDIHRVLADFVASHSATRLVTKTFLKSGPGQKVTITWSPRNIRGRLAIHVAQDETPPRMRLDRNVLRDWLHAKGYSPSDTIAQMEQRWNACSTRTILGGGTDYAGGRVEALDIPLLLSELKHYAHLEDVPLRR